MGKLIMKDKNALILIVDDAKPNIQVLGSFLKQEHYEIAIANSGPQALEMVEKTSPDLILLDILMPGMTGFEVCEKLKANPEAAEIPVIFLSALSDADDIVQGFKLGAVDYITKPFNSTELLARVHTHLELKNSKEALKTSNAAKDRFFSIIAHDLKNPFISIKSYLRLLTKHLESMSKEEVLNFTHELAGNMERTEELLENLLQWSRHQIGAIKYNPRSFNLNLTIQKNVDLLKSAAEKKHITLEFNTDHEITAYADIDMTETILRNLISNAIKFTHDSGKIEVLMENRENTIAVTVSDTGVGMNNEVQKKLFRIDEKITTEGTSEEKGSGLGLILCQELVRQQGGKIEVNSHVGRGSQITFTLQKVIQSA